MQLAVKTQKYLQYLKLQTDCEWQEVSPTLAIANDNSSAGEIGKSAIISLIIFSIARKFLPGA